MIILWLIIQSNPFSILLSQYLPLINFIIGVYVKYVNVANIIVQFIPTTCMETFNLHSSTITLIILDMTINLGNHANRDPLIMKDSLKSMLMIHLLCLVHIKVNILRDLFLKKKLENYLKFHPHSLLLVNLIIRPIIKGISYNQ